MTACANCGTLLHGEYCSHCGQPEHESHAPTIRHFFHELTHEVLHFDGKIFRTIKALVFAPGLLTAEYWSGHVASWIRPIRLFLIVAAVHLFASTGIGPFNYKVVQYRTAQGDFRFRVAPDANTQQLPSGSRKLSEEEGRAAFDKFEHVYLSIRYVSVVAFALASWLMYRRKQAWFINHLVGGLHFYSFWYLLAIATGLLGRWKPALNAVGILAIVYLYAMLWRLYKQPWFVTVFKTMGLFVILVAVELMLGFAGAIIAMPH